MFVTATTITGLIVCGALAVRHARSARTTPRRSEASVLPPVAIALTLGMATMFVVGGTASAAIVPTVPLATSADYAVLGASTVTNTGGTVLNGSLGLWPGTSIIGFPPGLVLPPGTTDTTNAAAQQAQSDLTTAYVNAAGRPINATTTADLGNLILGPGVYSGPSKGALGLTGPLVLDGEGNFDAVFIFQTDSSLTTASSSTVSLINGAQACNVFWQVGSSATLGTGSVFVGNILALTSITVSTGVTVEGRALARNGAVTLDTDTFVEPSCRQGPGTTTTTTPGGTTTTTTPGGTTTTTTPGGTTTTTGPGNTTTSLDVGAPTTLQTGGSSTTLQTGDSTTTLQGGTSSTQPGGGGTTTTQPGGGGGTGSLPRTGSSTDVVLLAAGLLLSLGAIFMRLGRERT